MVYFYFHTFTVFLMFSFACSPSPHTHTQSSFYSPVTLFTLLHIFHDLHDSFLLFFSFMHLHLNTGGQHSLLNSFSFFCNKIFAINKMEVSCLSLYMFILEKIKSAFSYGNEDPNVTDVTSIKPDTFLFGKKD